MATIAFDTLNYTRKLKAAGIPAAQAEAQAEIMAEAFLANVESLVTRDYLDARLDALQAHQDAKFDERLSLFETHVDLRLGRFDIQFAKMDGKFMLMFWMQGLIIVTVVVPAMIKFLS